MKNPNKRSYVQLPHGRKSLFRQLQTVVALAAASLILGWQPPAAAQGVVTDDFDSGVLDTSPSGWQQRNVVQGLGGFVENSFPDNGTGKAFRLRRGSADMSVLGFPQAYGTGRAWVFRTNDYSDFYVAMDLVAWNNDTNQALVLLARASGFDNSLGEGFPPGLGTTDGYVCNYDNVQDGTGSGDRKGGQFQINLVVGEAPITLCAAEVTLIPGHSYRQTFKGTNTTLIGQLYDLEDLTAPLVTIVADDPSYTSGNSGITTFHRDDDTHPNLTDMTVDNFYAGPSDPNADIAPAIRHPIAGTPQVVTRNPANRFTNFHPAASGISFTARTFTAAEINASATKLYLNGIDVSSSLSPFPANGSTVNFSTAAGTLTPNTTYSARIELVDTTGALTSTCTFWFDTFSDASVASFKTIEVEDYNYSNGVYHLEPIPVSGLDTNSGQVNGSIDIGGNDQGYFGFTGTPDVDYFKTNTGHYRLSWAEYRSNDRVQITQGSYSTLGDDEAADILDAIHPPPFRIHDTQRSKYVVTNVWEYQVRLTSLNDWMNYTRVFAPTNYLVYLRCGSFGDTEVYLDRVTTDPTQIGQTTERLGTFTVPNHLMRLNYRYEPLMDGGAPAVLSLSGTNTLRLTVGGVERKSDRVVVMDYLLFVPVEAAPVTTFFDNFNDGNDAAPPVDWVRYNPIQTGSWGFPDGNSYRIQSAPSPDPFTYFMGRAGSYLATTYSNFCVMVDIVGWDDSIHQICGLMARVGDPGPGTTTGYLFTHDRGNPANQGGDMDIVRLDSEFPTVLANISGTDSVYFVPGKSYRLVFTGVGNEFRGKVYELPNLSTPVVDITAIDDETVGPYHASGVPGLLVANNDGDYSGGADATFDNFLATTAEPSLSVEVVGGSVIVSWPQIPFRLQTSSSMSPQNWTTVTSGIVPVGDQNTYTVPATSQQYFRLVYP